MFKKILILSFILSSCTLLGGTEEVIQDNAVLYTGSGFSMQVPTLWTTNNTTKLPTPKSGTLEAALISPDVRYGFSNNLIIMKDTLNGIMTSERYAELNNVQTTRNYLEYTKIEDSPIIFSDTDNSRVLIFEAKYNPSTPRLKFIQTAKVCGTSVYLIHFSLALDKDPDAYVALVKTFACK